MHLSDKSIAVFNQFVDEMLRSDFIAHTEALVLYGGLDINESVYHFIEKYSFEDHEFSFEALKRYYSRFRRRTEFNSISA